MLVDPESVTPGARPAGRVLTVPVVGTAFADETWLRSDYFRGVIGALAEGVLVQDRAGTVLTVNQAAADVLGVELASLAGSNLANVAWQAVDEDGVRLRPEDRPGRQTILTGEPVLGRVFGLQRPNTAATKWIQIDCRPLTFPGHDRPHAVVSTVSDITERIMAQRSVAESARRRALVMAKSADGYRVITTDGEVLDAHSPPHSECAGRLSLDANWRSQVSEMLDSIRETLGATETRDIRVHAGSQHERWFECSVTNYLDEPAVGGLVINYRDVTTRKAAEDATKFQARLLDAAGQAIVATDDRGRVAFWNQAAEHIYGWSAAEARGRFITEVIEPLDSDAVVDAIAVSVNSGTSWSGDLWIRRRNGEPLPIFMTSTPAYDADGSFLAVVGVSTDITERKLAEETLSYQALHDPLTDLPNRLHLVGQMDRLLAQPQHRNDQLAVLFVDIDHFKVVNDGIGHPTGDAVLCAAARRLTEALPHDFVARFGGDEFVVLHVGTGEHSDGLIADVVLEAFDRPFVIEGRELHLSASVGIAYATPGDTSETLLRDADAAMYCAKEDGRAQARVFDERLRKGARVRVDYHTALRHAIERDEFRVHYQPIVALPEQTVVGFEALIRWEHPERGMISPDEFIPIAEETGLIVPIGQWVVHQAVHQLARWKNDLSLPDATMAVNLSTRQILDPLLVSSIESVIRSSGISPSQLVLEITESTLMKDIERSIRVLSRLRKLGVHLAIDDFGTGYSSLTYLKQLPVTTLKIDRSFITRLGSDLDDTSIVQAITSLGKALRLTTIAEGVETTLQLDTLNTLDCAQAQGYFWSPAIPADDIPALLPRMIER